MQGECIIEDSFIQDTGFDCIKEWLLNHCNCQENQNYFDSLTPISNTVELNNQLSETDELYKALLRKDILVETKVKNISRSIASLSIKGDFIDINKFSQIREMLNYHIKLVKYFKGNHFKFWKEILLPTNESKSIIKEINKIIDEELNIKKNASKEFSQINQLINQTQSKIESKITYELNKYIKLGYLRDNKTVFRSGKVLLPVNISNKKKVKGVIDGFSSTGQTCFVEPISIVELNNKMNELISQKEKEITKILIRLTGNISSNKDFLDSVYGLIKYYDIHCTIANLAVLTNSVKPEFRNELKLNNAINPLFTLKGKKYVPLNISIKNRESTVIVSGPNSGGKTVVIKSVGLYAVMAQCALYIPSTLAILPIFNSFLSDIGDKQSLNDDLSTFSAHMQEISNILRIADRYSLIIIDEMGTGTDPDIGSSLSIAILKKLTDKGSLNLCTTHLPPLKVWASENINAQNACMDFDNKKIEPTFIFQMGMPGSSYGIEIAARMGIHRKIIEDASLNLNQKSFEMEKLIKKINDKDKELTKKIDDLNSKGIDLSNKEIALNKIKTELDEKKKKIRGQELSESKKYILSYRKKIEGLIENIKRANADKLSIKKTKEFIDNTLQEIQEDEEENIKIEQDFSIGDYVKMRGVSEPGVIIKINGKTRGAVLEIDGKRISARISELIIANQTKKKKEKRNLISSIITPLQSQRLDLRGKRVDEAIMELDKFLDKAILSNLEIVDILHGKGTGALQEAIHKHLLTLKFIGEFNFAPINQGGTGITIVEIS